MPIDREVAIGPAQEIVHRNCRPEVSGNTIRGIAEMRLTAIAGQRTDSADADPDNNLVAEPVRGDRALFPPAELARDPAVARQLAIVRRLARLVEINLAAVRLPATDRQLVRLVAIVPVVAAQIELVIVAFHPEAVAMPLVAVVQTMPVPAVHAAATAWAAAATVAVAEGAACVEAAVGEAVAVVAAAVVAVAVAGGEGNQTNEEHTTYETKS